MINHRCKAVDSDVPLGYYYANGNNKNIMFISLILNRL